MRDDTLHAMNEIPILPMSIRVSDPSAATAGRPRGPVGSVLALRGEPRSPGTSACSDGAREIAWVSYAEHDLGDETALVRTYRPDRLGAGAFGPGFRAPIDASIHADDGGIVVSLPDGRMRFLPTSTGWLCTAGPLHDLESDRAGWRLHTHSGSTVEFDAVGRLTGWRSPSAHVEAAADTVGRVVTLHDRRTRRRLHLDWDGRRVVQLATDAGATTSYTYGTSGTSTGRLLRVCRPDGIVTYRWRGDEARREHRRRVS